MNFRPISYSCGKGNYSIITFSFPTRLKSRGTVGICTRGCSLNRWICINKSSNCIVGNFSCSSYICPATAIFRKLKLKRTSYCIFITSRIRDLGNKDKVIRFGPISFTTIVGCWVTLVGIQYPTITSCIYVISWHSLFELNTTFRRI